MTCTFEMIMWRFKGVSWLINIQSNYFFFFPCQIPKGLIEEIEAAEEVIKKGSVSQF